MAHAVTSKKQGEGQGGMEFQVLVRLLGSLFLSSIVTVTCFQIPSFFNKKKSARCTESRLSSLKDQQRVGFPLSKFSSTIAAGSNEYSFI
ncbi:hypothetical protein Y1Q_0008178 [Alligator mississippiensis]|uniref:Transmembrane protein n=1 Tax=Alligator mississippiensis TaxID=8496 RepID=A0A151N123_ALLMI|nr:hypothetical protein Y1Q_0008178 [Alligator mississippiensis]